MKVLLVKAPPSPHSISASSLIAVEPLALEYVGAGILKNHDVKLLDLRMKEEADFKETLESFQPDIIGSTGLTVEVNGVKQLFKEAKEFSPDILTVVGGLHATVVPTDMFDKNIDVIVTGEGVFPFREICNRFEQKKSFADIPNIYYRQDGKMAFTHGKPYPPLDDLPFPARSLTEHIRDSYSNPLLFKSKRMVGMRRSVGCKFNCKFCSVTKMMKGKLYTHSNERILEELAGYDEEVIFWNDDEFLLEPEAVLSLAQEIEKAGIKKKYFFSSRSDTVIKSPECIEAWARIGLEYVFVGLEGHREQDLKAFRKATTTTKNEECIHILRQNGVKIRGAFIINFDFEKKDFDDLSRYLKKIDVDIPSFSILTPFPGTDLYEEVKADMITDNYDLFDGMHALMPTKLPLKKFYNEYRKLILKKNMSFKKKWALWKQADPQTRKKIVPFMKMVSRRLKNAHTYFDKSFW